MANNISVTILTKNSADCLVECLNALDAFAEVVIIDNGSTDETISIASGFKNVNLYEHSFIDDVPLEVVVPSVIALLVDDRAPLTAVDPAV